MNDRELSERFAELRDEESALTPPFVVRSRRRRAWWLVPAFATLLIAIIFLPRRETTFTREDREAARALSTWNAPTDFLLRTPGSDVLDSVPDIPSKGVTP